MEGVAVNSNVDRLRYTCKKCGSVAYADHFNDIVKVGKLCKACRVGRKVIDKANQVQLPKLGQYAPRTNSAATKVRRYVCDNCGAGYKGTDYAGKPLHNAPDQCIMCESTVFYLKEKGEI